MTPAESRQVLLQLCRRQDLSRAQAQQAFAHIMSGQASEAFIGGLLVGLAAKGTTIEELTGAALVMRERSTPIDTGNQGDITDFREAGTAPDPALAVDAASNVILDTCGTGGDVRGTFNISTAAAIIAAAAGARVVKHGNRSASGKTGSADVLEKLGVKLEVSPEILSRCLREANLCFAFARSHHPAMKYLAAARSALGIPTIFNILGPLTNPARAKHQLLGVFAAELTERLAHVLQEMGSQRAWVVHADDGLDELSTLGPTKVSELQDGQIITWTLNPKQLGLSPAKVEDLQVNDVAEAAEALKEIFAGRKGPRRDIAILNAAAALVIAGSAADLPGALAMAAHAIDSGSARETLRRLVAISALG